MKSIIKYPQIGDIEICTRKNTLRTTFSVSIQKVRITTSPFLVNTLFPLSEKRVNWILNAQQKLKERYATLTLLPTSEIKTCFFTIRFVLDTCLQQKHAFALRRESDELRIYYCSEIDFEQPKIQQTLKRILQQILKDEAKSFLPNRLKENAEKYNFTFESVHINSATTRWGSCSSKKRINLSCYLMLLPLDLIDFVLVHELCHTEQMNHSTDFKRKMKSIFPNNELLNERLKEEAKKALILKI